MQNNLQKSVKHKISLRMVLIILLAVIALAVGGFFLWAGDYYRADGVAVAAMQGDNTLTTDGNLTTLAPSIPSDTGIIFYPGAKVEASAYLPLLEKLKQKGYTCVLVTMPLNMAIFDEDAADAVFGKVPGIKNWYMAGHSMGGAMASSYAAGHPVRVAGLILLGAYIYGDYPPADALTIYGSFNERVEQSVHYTENIVKIEGGNHAQFGNYGKQKGDPDATITAEEQQNIAVEAISQFIESRRAKA